MQLNVNLAGQPPLRVFIGYDEREPDAWEVCAASLRRYTSIPLAIHALKQDRLRARGLYTRPEDEKASTQFAHTRFLVPALCDYQGYALFVDCDFLFTQDIAKLWPHCDRNAAVNVVKHDYTPKSVWKMDGQPQVAYPRKNWSSLMVFNCGHENTKQLTPAYVNNSPAANLHRFAWCKEDAIHALPSEWNWLEGEYGWPVGAHFVDRRIEPPAAIHFTNGGPWFDGCMGVTYADLWIHALAEIRKEQGQ